MDVYMLLRHVSLPNIQTKTKKKNFIFQLFLQLRQGFSKKVHDYIDLCY